MAFDSLGTINQYPDPVLVVASPAEIYYTLRTSGGPGAQVAGWHGSGTKLTPDASLQFDTSNVTNNATMVASYYRMQPVMLTGARELNIEYWNGAAWARGTNQWHPQNITNWPRMLRVSVRLVDKDGRAGTDGRWFTQVLSIKD
jgi:hypothetical protein